MSVRTHFTEATNLAMSVFVPDESIPEVYAGTDQEERTELRLILEDGGNCEALVIDGSVDDLLALSDDIRARVERVRRSV